MAGRYHSAAVTLDEYFRIDNATPERCEYRDGEVVVLDDGTVRSSLTAANVTGELGRLLRGSRFIGYAGNLRYAVPNRPYFLCPDGSFGDTDAPVEDPRDPDRRTINESVLFVEVATARSLAFDRGGKFELYRQFETLGEYLLVQTDRPRVEVRSRQGDRTWVTIVYDGLEAVARLRSLGVDLPLAEVYRGVRFPSPDAAAADWASRTPGAAVYDPRTMAEPNTPDGRVALLVVDVINDLEFPGGDRVLPWARKMVGTLRPAIAAAGAAGVPVVYANDNFGHWRSDVADVVRHCTRDGARGRDVTRALAPGPDDYFVLKPKQSAFFATSLVPLLGYLRVDRLVLAGMATNLCVFFTAHDAHTHEYDVTVLSDCCAAESDADHDVALDQLTRFLHVRVCRGDEYRF